MLASRLTVTVRQSRARIVFCVALMALCGSGELGAQRADSVQAAVRALPRDTTAAARPRPPLSPRRAFAYSLLLPGYGQSRLGRPTAGGLFLVTESIALAMLRESSANLRQARRFESDSLIIVGYTPDGAPVRQVSPYTQSLINTRRGHVEDWIAFLIANHLFAAADAYVAAHLWDLPTQISVESRPAGAVVLARVHW